MTYSKIITPMLCNELTGECREFDGPWPIKILMPWLWWMLL